MYRDETDERIYSTGAVFAGAVDFVAGVTDAAEAWHEVLTGALAADAWYQRTLVDV